MTTAAPIPDGRALQRRFDETGGLTVGLEEEVMLLDPVTLDLTAAAHTVCDRASGDPRFKRELPAAQLEIVTEPAATVREAVEQLAQGRRDLAAAAAGLARPAAVGVHPTASPLGALSDGDRYAALHREYGSVARVQLVAALQIHVAVGGHQRTLAVYNALRGLLPEIAALSANAPFYCGVDSQLASVRPGICVQLPRQGVPPTISSWEQFAQELAWGARSAVVADAATWWWELRPHIVHGTLELRVPDAQTTVAEAAGIIAFVQALVATLADRFDAGEPLVCAPSWRIQENRWSALRHGVQGTLADLVTGRRRGTRERLHELVEWIVPAARRLGGAELLRHTRESIDVNGAMRQRAAAATVGVTGLPGWAADRFLASGDG
jgi:carboxylate-amine ligase